MPNLLELSFQNHGERFYDITNEVKSSLNQINALNNGLLYLFCLHTSCALTISESFDPSAKNDLEEFLKNLAPRNAKFITHTTEGPDDSPSHMKSILLNQHICLPVVDGNLLLGTWQGIYLAEFRDAPHKRKIMLKYMPDS